MWVLARIPPSILLLKVECEHYPPLQYQRGGCDVGVGSHPTLPSVREGRMQASPGGCKVRVGSHPTLPSIQEGRMRAVPSSTVQ